MNQKYWQKIESILDNALALRDPQEKDDYIVDACKDDDQLYREVTLLMQSIQKSEEEGFLEIADK